ncbi:MAG: adenine phosphoribosyltransferase [Myxococcota bacterium]|nr:adenine phosphoribosyltransferase [Myxococcota bacterium]
MNIRDLIRDVPDFPKPGILFKDITPVLSQPDAMDEVVDALASLTRVVGATKVIGIESRGFIFGTPVSYALDLPFVPVRKPGKLPYTCRRVEYALEYGTDTLEMHTDAITEGERVVIVDDLLATGGTAEAACQLVEEAGGVVAAILVVIELVGLDGRQRLSPRQVHSLIQY